LAASGALRTCPETKQDLSRFNPVQHANLGTHPCSFRFYWKVQEAEMRKPFLIAVMVVAGATAAFAAQGTVNSYTPSQEDRAKSAIVHAGYRPDDLAAVQDGNFFFTATKGDEFYQATVTPSGKVFVSTGLPEAAKPAAG
jgi:hypothetical protein